MRYLSKRQLELKHARIIKKADKAGIPVISRADAKYQGLKRFFDGRLCPSGHISERYVSSGACVECNHESVKTWRGNNPKRHSDNTSRYRKNRSQVDPEFAMRVKARALVANAIARMGFKKGSKTEAILGCSWGEFKAHIERQFLPGMSWSNWGKWHIDHIVPISSATTEQEVLSLSHHTNLRPLWAEDNLKKSSKLEFII